MFKIHIFYFIEFKILYIIKTNNATSIIYFTLVYNNTCYKSRGIM